ncbi:MAG: tetratricopeptide repeat protein [Vampirovibrionales bacterium]
MCVLPQLGETALLPTNQASLNRSLPREEQAQNALIHQLSGGPGGIQWLPLLENSSLQGAVTLLKQGEEWKALGAFQSTWQRQPDSWEAQLGVASVYAWQGQYGKAIGVLRSDHAFEYPEHPVLLAMLAWWIYLKHELPTAGTQCKVSSGDTNDTSLEETPAMVDDLLSMAKTYQANHPTVLLVEAHLAMAKGQTAQAQAHLKTLALGLKGQAWAPLVQAEALLAMHLEDLPRARAMLQLAYELDPQDPLTLYYMGRLLAQADSPNKALAYLQQSQKAWPMPFPPRDLLMVRLLALSGQHTLAIQRTEPLLKAYPCSTTLKEQLFALYQASGKPWPSRQWGDAPHREVTETKHWEEAWQRARGQSLEEALHTLYVLPFETLSAAQQRDWLWLTAHTAYANTYFGVPFGGEMPSWHGRWMTRATAAMKQSHPVLTMDELAWLKLVWESVQQGVHTGFSEAQIAMLERLAGFPRADVFSTAGPIPPLAHKALDAMSHPLPWTPSDEERSMPSMTSSKLVQGMAQFVLRRYQDSWETLGELPLTSPEEVLKTADLLLLLQEFSMARGFYERVQRESKIATTLEASQQGLTLLQQKMNLVDQKILAADAHMAHKRFTAAHPLYEQAALVVPQSLKAHIRLAESFEHMKRWREAWKHYRTALMLQPSLSRSPQFMQHYRHVESHLPKQAPPSDVSANF